MSFSDEDILTIKSWGFNSVRLGLLWAGAEPSRGNYSMEYLNTLRNITDRLGKQGIYTYLELHQDVLSEHFCGDGIPVWAVEVQNAWDFPKPLSFFNYSYDNHGLPSPKDCANTNWANYYGTSAVGMAFQSIYDNHNGVSDALGDLWKVVAHVWADSEWLLGYELMNEPWAGDHLGNPSLMLPGVSDRVNLAPFYERMHKAIREVTPASAFNHCLCQT